uniref:Uncharacterized protein n=1 Tax=Oryza glumipatula TaxID=40148 RepID=A0A0D9Y7L6_9ORYZ
MADLRLLVVERILHGDNPRRLTLSPRPLQRAGTCIDAFQLKYVKDSVYIRGSSSSALKVTLKV